MSSHTKKEQMKKKSAAKSKTVKSHLKEDIKESKESMMKDRKLMRKMKNGKC